MTRRSPASAAEPADRCHQFAIGDIGVAVRTPVPHALDDFSSLYDTCRRERGVSGKLIHMEVRRHSKGPIGRRQYDIVGDGEVLSTARTSAEILPHLEWGINRRVIATRSEFVQLHAATLVRGGRGVIIAGPSGAGKSTLTAGLIARGWQYLSDEFALIHARTGMLHPFPRAVSVKAGSFPIVERLGLPLFRKRPYVRDLKGPLGYIRPADVGRNVVAEPAPPRLVVLPRYTGHDTVRTREIPRARAAFRLAGQMLNREMYDARVVPILARVMAEARCYALECGPLDAACDRVESLLGQADTGAPSACPCVNRKSGSKRCCGGQCGRAARPT
ncbi:MAG: hypothetical protein HKO59_17050 [Phycisphaerales bacterium]|nr:hypothetical protein [Phycisphaerales bacterium]